MREIEQLEVDLGAGGFLRITQTDWVRRRHILRVTVDTTGQATIQLIDGSWVAVDPRYLEEFGYGLRRSVPDGTC